MKKRIAALVLCALMLVPMFCSCSTETVKSQMQIYLAHQVYDLDPLNAYTNDAQLKIVSLIFSGLYKIDENGKVTEDLVKSCEVDNDLDKKEYTLRLTLNSTCWSDGSSVSADDVVYTFKRVLKAQNTNDAAALLFKIKNAVRVKNGDASIDDLKVYAVDTLVVEIQFEKAITDADLAEFKLNLTSPALYPLRENVVDGKIDWAKKPATMVCSGPFIVRKVSYEDGKRTLVLERNSYYYRNREKDSEDKYVTPYKIYIDYEYTREDQAALFVNGQNLYVGEIPLSLRAEYASQAKVSDALSTHTYLLNQNALVASTKAGEEAGFALFAIKEVRQALSLAVDRAAIASAIVFADPASGIVPNGVFNTTSANKTFRAASESLIASSADAVKAASLISGAGINPADYTFAISVRQGDEVHAAIANTVCAAWAALGFNVSVKEVGVENKQQGEVDGTGEVQKDIRDDLFDEAYKAGNFEAMAIDLIAKSPDPFSVLAPFADAYNGNLCIGSKGEELNTKHITGYSSEAYNELIDKAYKAKTAEEKATYLHEAEAILAEDTAVIPIVFNKNAVLIGSSLSGLKMSYYGFYNFKNATLKDWVAYRDMYYAETSEAETEADEETTGPTE